MQDRKDVSLEAVLFEAEDLSQMEDFRGSPTLLIDSDDPFSTLEDRCQLPEC